jgi:N-acetylmuramic acid 6-phosphate (MurNAc-6-P) etherase
LKALSQQIRGLFGKPITKKTMSITETSNALTADIDIASPEGIARLLRQGDAQLFSGYGTYASIFDDKSMESILTLAIQMRNCIDDYLEHNINDPNTSPLIVFTGCGTSGRLAYFCAKNYNKCLQYHFNEKHRFNCFGHIIAGSDKALVKPQEAAEDSPVIAVEDWKKITSYHDPNKNKRQIYVGITCGLSAPYIAGQLDHLLEQNEQNQTSKCAVTLLGFNPIELARTVPMENWPTHEKPTFKQFVDKLAEKQNQDPENYIIINPVVGPESITGSTRMKGGSATKIVLDLAFATAIMSKVTQTQDRKQLREWMFAMLQSFELGFRNTFDKHELHFAGRSPTHGGVSELMSRASHSLRTQGHLYYVGCNNAGILGFVDASECLPTYGTKLTDVRGFVHKGWETIYGNNVEKAKQCNMEQYGDEFKFTFALFKDQIVDKLQENDSIFFVAVEGDVETEELEEMFSIARLVRSKGCKVSWVYVTGTSYALYDINPFLVDNFTEKIRTFIQDQEALLVVNLSFLALVPELGGYGEYALKLILNVISTGAHVLKGMTYGNRMINLKVSNNKLYHRSVNIVSTVMNVSTQVAEQCILRSIYEDGEIPDVGINQHISKAVGLDKVVPVALLLASGHCKTVAEARERLSKEPVVRNVILNAGK